jgi:hypothetical protein
VLNKILHHRLFLFILLLLASLYVSAQRPVIRPPGGGIPNLPGMGSRGGGGGANADSVRHRNDAEDSVNVKIYYLDTTRAFSFDTSLNDFTKHYPIPATHTFLGNTGSPTRSLLFTPNMQVGWDPGFHALDVYRKKIENVRFFNTNRPFTELGYTLGSKAEQIIDILTTQNIKPYWNASFNYRLVSSPGLFRNQRSNNNSYSLSSWYQSPKKRYNNYFIFLFNKLQSGENGGIANLPDLTATGYTRDPYTVPTRIGGVPSATRDYFSTQFYTGHREKDFNIFMRQQYDLGRKDSLVTDSLVIPLFFPRVRFEHNIRFTKSSYFFQDQPYGGSKQSNFPDSLYYSDNYNIHLVNDSITLLDEWRLLSNDFSFYQFPDEKNLQQFIKLGAELQLIKGTLKTTNNYYNFIGHGEYRNRTKNQKWDIIANGQFYLNGLNLGDYHAYVSLERLLSEKLGSLQIGFENSNRSPSFIFRQQSNYYLDQPKDFNKENIIHFFGSYLEPKLKLQLTGDYYLVSNYLYLREYYKLKQESALFNVLKIGASKTFHVGRHWNWYADAWIQQKTGAVDLNMPFFFTRNRFAFEGRFFKNLNLSTGLELRYHSPYKADDYSPVLGQFFYQDSVTINNRPDIAAFFHIRIRTFKAYIRAENLNTISNEPSFGFNHFNFAAPRYPTPNFMIRFGIYWNFVN